MKIFPEKIAVVGLGYVGLPVAVAFGKKQEIIGFDINEKRIEELKIKYDRNKSVLRDSLQCTNITFTSNKQDLKEVDFIIVTVPTPINEHKQPDLTYVFRASEIIGSILKKGTIVVYESTVYPGATMNDCVPILEEFSDLKNGEDFYVGYSPERINPGDKEHTFETIKKVVSGQTPEVLEIVTQVYTSVIEAGVHKAPTIEVAEASKLVENIQRDINIALMNELSLIFDRANINTKDVLNAARTKWNFINFQPGLVGGHCISVDPYYLTHKAQELGYHPELIFSARKINENLSSFIASAIIKRMIKKGLNLQNATVNLFGLTFKENCPDLRNTKVIDIIKELEDYGINVVVNDPQADKNEAESIYQIRLKELEEMNLSDVLVFAVCHYEYLTNKEYYLSKLNNDGIIFDLKGIISNEELKDNQSIWRL